MAFAVTNLPSCVLNDQENYGELRQSGQKTSDRKSENVFSMKCDPISEKSVDEVLKLSLYSNQPLLSPQKFSAHRGPKNTVRPQYELSHYHFLK